MPEITMPRLSDSMEEGTILKWLVAEGDEVKRGQPIAEIETDKANMTYETDTDGTVSELVAQEGDTLAIGEVIARIGEGNGKPKSEKKEEEPEQQEEPAKEKEPEQEEPQQEERKPQPSSNGGERVKASPVARRMAGEMGVELAQLEGSGPGGRIVKADVEAAAKDGGERKPAAAPAAQRGEAGAKGKVEYQELAVELRQRLKEVADPAPSVNDMVVKAVAVALRDHRRVNGAYRDGKFELYSRVNVGIAVAGQDALVVPTIFDADQKSLGQIAKDARELIGKVREGQITPPEVSGGTFTVSNLGMYGIDNFSAIINPPQAALLTVGALKKRAIPDERGRVAVRDMMNLTLVCDHRILYGADGAEFLARVRELLESPLSLAL
jgi:pyruvate dehydrogenase E2 component (dihydrolipoamide acetyltransferase)